MNTAPQSSAGHPVNAGSGRLILGCVIGVACALVALAASWALSPLTTGTTQFILLTGAVTIASACGGLPALLAVAAGLIGALAIGLSGFGNVDAVAFASIGIVIAVFGERWHRDRHEFNTRARELKSSEAHLQSILATVPDAMIVIDDKGRIESFSAAAERLFGHTARDVIGRNISMMMPSPHREAHDSYIERYLTTGERRIIGSNRIVAGERKDGTTFPMELTVGEARSSERRFFTGFVRDLTERRRTEAQLEVLQAELVHMSRLTAMGEMASTLAHELNQPLAAIANYLKGSQRLLERLQGDQVPTIRDALDKAAAQAIRAGQIIRRLREFVSRGESERREESLSRMIEEASALALVGAKEQGVQLRLQFDQRYDEVLADKVQIQQVLLNLMRNAVEAMTESNGPRRELNVATREGAGGMVEISVSDSGPGVASDFADRLFQPFATTKDQGMGVGLSISKTIVEAHGGRIWFQPTPGGGATFVIALPVAPSEEAENVR
jgi:two-component system sensor kinase FixL